MPSPTCTVNATSTTDGVNVTAASTVTIALADVGGVTQWSISCIGTDEELVAATVTAGLTINYTNKTATFTAPDLGSALIFQSTINNGQDINGRVDPTYTTTFGVYVLTADSSRVAAQNETTEGSAAYGWVGKINAFIRNPGGANPAVTSLTASSFVSIGGTVSTTGSLRVASGFALRGRNNANSANVDLLTFAGATDAIDLGDSTNCGSVTVNVKTGGYFRVGVNGSETVKLDETGGEGKFTLGAARSGMHFAGSGGQISQHTFGSMYTNCPTHFVRAFNGTLHMTVGVSGTSSINLAASTSLDLQYNGTSRIKVDSTGTGFFAAAPVAKPTVTGSRGGNAALASLLTALANLGLITDSSTA